MPMVTLPEHTIWCDSKDPYCYARLVYSGYTKDDKLVTAAVARKMAKEQGWDITPKRLLPSSKRIHGWTVLCPEHKDQTSKVEG